ncbi:HelD family protein [Bailinhaonella thermotolerans]|uniref:Helicase n=1 Tax=Bailinhaonella thermotolerans TaxID=1070861 RepID=A0A3A4AKU6_9ACTN|nr:ATP-binding domain-containing protein [Bailinhaonella thermotolerans]RJL27137.1 helicase [Bailinhaonella thermotolerans]
MSRRQSADPRRDAIAEEQPYVSRLYSRLDEVRARTAQALRDALGRDGGRTPQALVEREAAADEHARAMARLDAVEDGLCFGRVDRVDGQTLYIGRVGLRDAAHEPLLIDWRAPAARPFYRATPGDPDGLARRRHLHLRARRVVGVEDEVFDLDGLPERAHATLVGEAALLAALRRARTGRMGDIVATIQAEQDRVIRSRLQGVLVVQGGPGTGKTVAALHRAAYLLYTHRDTLARRGVLVVGPNATFLRYIAHVLPSLGETDVVLATPGELFPGVRATAGDTPEAAVVKGGLSACGLLRAAVADRQRVPDGDLEVVADELPLRVPHAVCREARDRARALGVPHNAARTPYLNLMLTALAEAEAALLDRPMDAEDRRYARKALWADPAVRAALDALWPELTPRRLLRELFADPAALDRAAAAAGLPVPATGEALLRPAGAPWTVGDVPLLDEAAELLGVDPAPLRAAEERAERDRRAREAYAAGVLMVTGQWEEETVDVAGLAERHRDPGPHRTTAERAAADREWAYGHVIVDEAQELSAMAWRMIMRRVPTRSMTVVGDLAQTGSPAGVGSWAEALGPYVGDRWREERLTVNYRTPAEIMEPAADVLRAVAPGQEPPESVRHGGHRPRAARMGPDGLPCLVDRELHAVGAGRLAVIASRAWLPAACRALPRAAAAGLDDPVVLLTATAAKGLEFDAVIVADPAGILAESPAGGRDLYVALTRATRRLTVVHDGDLPPVLSRLSPSPA